MVSLQAVQAHNAMLKSRGPGLVGVFVGGTSGISLSTARAFVRSTVSPRIYLVGRNQVAADEAINSLKAINPTAHTTFLKSDVSLLRNVDSVCDQIKANESKVNLLFMTPGYLTTKGRDETAEGLDRKFSVHYYARMRFATNLQPLLTAAAEDKDLAPASRLSRVVSVMDPWAGVRLGQSGTLDYSDLSLKRGFSLAACAAHASIMNNFFVEELSRRHPSTSFMHAYPSGVETGVLRELWFARIVIPVIRPLAYAFNVMVPLEQSGERHLFAATSPRFPPKEDQTQHDQDVAIGSDGQAGSGSYWLSWDGEVFPENRKLVKRRDEGALEKIAKHTDEVFRQICEQGKTYP